MDDQRLEALRLRGCNHLQLRREIAIVDEHENFAVTEEGILAYCFVLDADKPEPERRSFFLANVASVDITPAFFTKVVKVP